MYYEVIREKCYKWLGIYSQRVFVLAEPAEPSPGFRPCTPRVPPGLTEHSLNLASKPMSSHINLNYFPYAWHVD